MEEQATYQTDPMQSPDIGKLAEALAAFQGEMPEIKLDSTVKVKMKSGGSYTFSYATLQNIMRKVLPVLSKHGLSITQTFDGACLETTLMHKSGQRITSTIPVDLKSGSMQEIGSRISYLRRYQISPLLGIVADADDDANIADGNEYKKETPKKPATKPKETPIQTMIKKFAKAKEVLKGKTGDDSIYYAALETLGVKHANEINKENELTIEDGNELLAEFRTFLAKPKETFPPEEEIPY